MVPRVWTCGEQHPLLVVLSVSLKPVVIGLLVVGALLALMRRRPLLSRLLFRTALVASVSVLAAVAAFTMASVALAKTESNPTLVLRWAPWVWAGLGPLSLAVAFKPAFAAQDGWRRLLQREAPMGGRSPPSRLLVVGGLACAFVATTVLGARYFISDEHSRLSAPYRLFEFLVPDQIELIASDDCLAQRVLEYGDSDPFVGRPAARKLASRGSWGIDAVVTRLNEVREKWPAEPHQVTEDGVLWSMRFLAKRHAESRLRSWEDLRWRQDLVRLNARPPFSLRYGPL
jgi:hypothetical protein